MNDEESAWLRTVGMRIRLGRVAQRESQDALAARSGVSRVTLGSIERGEHAAGLVTYMRIARTLGIPLNELLDGAP